MGHTVDKPWLYVSWNCLLKYERRNALIDAFDIGYKAAQTNSEYNWIALALNDRHSLLHSLTTRLTRNVPVEYGAEDQRVEAFKLGILNYYFKRERDRAEGVLNSMTMVWHALLSEAHGG